MNKKKLLGLLGVLTILTTSICYKTAFADLSNTTEKSTYINNENVEIKNILTDLTTNYDVTSIPISQLSDKEKANLPKPLNLKVSG